MKDQPKDKVGLGPKTLPPNFDEDLKRQLGPEKMSFLSEMLRPDAEDERGDEHMPAPSEDSGPAMPPEHTPEEAQAIIERLEQYFGRKPTPEEIHLALDQARWV